MKKYWPVMGAIGVAATLGSYFYVSRDPLYDEPESEEEFVEEEIVYEAELPEEEIEMPPSYTPKKAEKEKPKRKKNSQNNHRKETQPRKQSYHQTLPQTSSLEETVEEENEERPSYDLPQEERIKLGVKEIDGYFYKALEADDFKVAESYISNKQRLFQGIISEQDIYAGHLNSIVVRYNKYLSNVIENCNKYDFDSLFRKVTWMNLIMANNQEIFSPHFNPHKEPDRELHYYEIIQKGNQALEAIEYCK